MICLYYLNDEWEFYTAREITTLPSELPFKKRPIVHSYMLLNPLIKPSLPIAVLSLDVFKVQTIEIPKEIEKRLLIN